MPENPELEARIARIELGAILSGWLGGTALAALSAHTVMDRVVNNPDAALPFATGIGIGGVVWGGVLMTAFNPISDRYQAMKQASR